MGTAFEDTEHHVEFHDARGAGDHGILDSQGRSGRSEEGFFRGDAERIHRRLSDRRDGCRRVAGCRRRSVLRDGPREPHDQEMSNTITNLLLGIIAALLAGIGSISIWMINDTRDWLRRMSNKVEVLSEQFFKHIGDHVKQKER